MIMMGHGENDHVMAWFRAFFDSNLRSRTIVTEETSIPSPSYPSSRHVRSLEQAPSVPTGHGGRVEHTFLAVSTQRDQETFAPDEGHPDLDGHRRPTVKSKDVHASNSSKKRKKKKRRLGGGDDRVIRKYVWYEEWAKEEENRKTSAEQ
jgi:hypothetical protein